MTKPIELTPTLSHAAYRRIVEQVRANEGKPLPKGSRPIIDLIRRKMRTESAASRPS
ncbi:MAG: hypothetical protein RL095_1328 [Verrucomicrobiota bacterium]|jgi:hypothetical protein